MISFAARVRHPALAQQPHDPPFQRAEHHQDGNADQ
jgi:hypothetical protein